MKKRNGILASFAVISLTLAVAAVAGCAKPTYEISVTGGKASVTEAAEGTEVTLTPDAAAVGQEFVGWTVNGESIEGNTFEMPAEDVTVEAVFEAIDYTLTITGGSAMIGDEVVTTANYQDEVTLGVDLEAVPADKGFSHWNVTAGDVDITDGSFTMPAENVAIEAVYAQLYDVAVNGGTADVQSAIAGTTITLTAQPPKGMALTQWLVDGKPIEGNTFALPEKDVEVEAEFDWIDYNITVTGGSATIGGEAAATGNYEQEVTLTVDEEAIPEKKGFDYWTVNGEKIEGNTFKMPDADVVVEAVYFNYYSVNITDGKTDKELYKEGETVTLTADTKENYTFWYWEVNGVRTEGNIFLSPAYDSTVKAVYVQTTRQLAAPDNSTNLLLYRKNNTIEIDRAETSMFTEGLTDHIRIDIYDSVEGNEKLGSLNLYVTGFGSATETKLTTSDGTQSLTVLGNAGNLYLMGDGFTNFFELLAAEIGENYSDTTSYYISLTAVAITDTVKDEASGFDITYKDSEASVIGTAALVRFGPVTVTVIGGYADGEESKTVHEGESVTLTTTVPENKVFTGWYEVNADGTLAETPVSTSLSCEYVVDADATVQAVFVDKDQAQMIQLVVPDNSQGALLRRNGTGGAIEANRATDSTGAKVSMFGTGVDHALVYVYTSADGGESVGQFKMFVNSAGRVIAQSLDGRFSVEMGSAGDSYTTDYDGFFAVLARAVGNSYSDATTYYFAVQLKGAVGSVYEDSELSAIGPNGFARDLNASKDTYTVTITGGKAEGDLTAVEGVNHGAIVVITADEAEEGKVFAYWALYENNEEDSILTVEKELVYRVTGNADIRAVFLNEGEKLQVATPNNSTNGMIKFSSGNPGESMSTIEFDRGQAGGTAFSNGVSEVAYYIYTSNEEDAEPVAKFSIRYDGTNFKLVDSEGTVFAHNIAGTAGNLYLMGGNGLEGVAFIKAAYEKDAGVAWDETGATSYYFACQAKTSLTDIFEDSEIGAKGSAWGSLIQPAA